AEERLSETAAIQAVIRDNLYGLEIDPRCTQIGAFNLALAAWRRVGHCSPPAMHIACSGLAPNATEDEWVALAEGNSRLEEGMRRLYGLFKDAPVLGSLINPRAEGYAAFEASFAELQPILEKALASEGSDDAEHEMAVTARGVAKAAEILGRQFTLLATNVPYLGHTKHCDSLRSFCATRYPQAKWDVYSVFMERLVALVSRAGTRAIVTPAEWTFLKPYKAFRTAFIKSNILRLGAKLGFNSFATPIRANPLLSVVDDGTCGNEYQAAFLDTSDAPDVPAKVTELRNADPTLVEQLQQLTNPDARILLNASRPGSRLLADYATALTGLSAGDSSMFDRHFWEVESFGDVWEPTQSSVSESCPFGGRSGIVRWEKEAGLMADLAARVRHLNHAAQNWRRGKPAWGKQGVAISLMGQLSITRYGGQKYDINCCAIIPNDPADLLALWMFAEEGALSKEIRLIDQSLKLAPHTLLKVPFDRDHWHLLALERYAHGLPAPHSSDPTQWLFNGHPKDSNNPLHVAVARLVGYRWPRQTGSEFPDCPAIGPDGLEKHADADGIVCLSSIRGEPSAADRLINLLEGAYGTDWSGDVLANLLTGANAAGKSLDDWLRDWFFDQHVALFHQRPFVWHVWDGLRDGFNALVNYHRLAGPDGQGSRTLQKLTFEYLGDW
ncbi:MAG: Eco57I restriction-modification methylase domain-containing protein, partial [Planctomycetia bacterium]